MQSFYTTKLQEQIDLLGDEEAKRLWEKMKCIIPEFFKDIDVKPSLLHGDLWSGNAGTVDGNPGDIVITRYYLKGHNSEIKYIKDII